MTSRVSRGDCASGIMGYGSTADAKNGDDRSAVMRHMREATSLKLPTGREWYSSTIPVMLCSSTINSRCHWSMQIMAYSSKSPVVVHWNYEKNSHPTLHICQRLWFGHEQLDGVGEVTITGGEGK